MYESDSSPYFSMDLIERYLNMHSLSKKSSAKDVLDSKRCVAGTSFTCAAAKTCFPDLVFPTTIVLPIKFESKFATKENDGRLLL